MRVIRIIIWRMIICICNGVRKNDIAGAANAGACCASDMFSSMGCSPICGQCVPYIDEILESGATRPEKTCN